MTRSPEHSYIDDIAAIFEQSNKRDVCRIAIVKIADKLASMPEIRQQQPQRLLRPVEAELSFQRRLRNAVKAMIVINMEREYALQHRQQDYPESAIMRDIGDELRLALVQEFIQLGTKLGRYVEEVGKLGNSIKDQRWSRMVSMGLAKIYTAADHYQRTESADKITHVSGPSIFDGTLAYWTNFFTSKTAKGDWMKAEDITAGEVGINLVPYNDNSHTSGIANDIEHKMQRTAGKYFTHDALSIYLAYTHIRALRAIVSRQVEEQTFVIPALHKAAA